MLNIPKISRASGDAYHLPEESEPHTRTFMQWPVSRTVHPDSVFLNMLQDAIADVANAIAEFEPVVLLMGDEHAKNAGRKLSREVEIWNIATDDLWCRDSGPVFVKNDAGQLAVANLNFNGWGNKQVHTNDGQIAQKIAKRLDLPLIDSGITGEAGGIESDGNGTLMAHESSWVNPNRNRQDRATIELNLLKALGGEKLIWAPGIAGEDITDYHIDSLARFSAPGKVLIQLPREIDRGDPWAKVAWETHGILKQATDAKGRKLELVVIDEPERPRVKSLDFVASYVNYYVCNGAVICAQFGDKRTDAMALKTLERLYPEREIIALNVDPIGEVGGGIHCATQQQPAI